MIFRTGNGRTLWQRALYWIEEKANGLQRELHHERKAREQRYERRHKPYYDTFRSWTDELSDDWRKDGSGVFRLFVDASRGCQAHLCNFEGRGTFPGGETFIANGMKVEVVASDPTVRERVLAGTQVELSVGSMEMINFALGDLAAQGFPRWEHPITLTPYQNFYVKLDFSPEAGKLLRELKTKIGPGAGWVSIRVTLDGILKREVL